MSAFSGRRLVASRPGSIRRQVIDASLQRDDPVEQVISLGTAQGFIKLVKKPQEPRPVAFPASTSLRD